MKANKILSGKNEQQNLLPAQSDKERKGRLAPWQKEIVALAEARLSVYNEETVVSDMHRRVIRLCKIVEDIAVGNTGSDVSLDGLYGVMIIIEEHIQIAKWISDGRSVDPGYWDAA